ncbi:MAG: hypothetical protein K9K80_02060 [Spirochaetia bacterium]|nr:hypothetical protein [Spirochaetia bacterium]
MNIEEPIISGIKELLVKYLNEEIQSVNTENNDEYVLSPVNEDCIAGQFTSVEAIMSKKRKNAFPFICYYINESYPEIKTNNLDNETTRIVIAIFTRGDPDDTLMYRYVGILRKIFREHDDEIFKWIFRAKITGKNYYLPTELSGSIFRIAELILEIETEVR